MQTYPYYIVESTKLKREFEDYARLHHVPKNVMRSMSGSKQRRSDTFEDELSACRAAVAADRTGAEVDVYEVASPRQHRRRINDWRARAR